jgi:hypothetical protein
MIETIGPHTAYLRKQGGSVSHGHLIDTSLLGMLAAAVSTPIIPADFRLWAVAVVGALLGGLIGARMFRADGETLFWQWGISSACAIVFSPLLFDLLSQPSVLVEAAVIPYSINSMMALSALVGISSWGTLRALNVAWLKHIKRRFDIKARDDE